MGGAGGTERVTGRGGKLRGKNEKKNIRTSRDSRTYFRGKNRVEGSFTAKKEKRGRKSITGPAGSGESHSRGKKLRPQREVIK